MLQENILIEAQCLNKKLSRLPNVRWRILQSPKPNEHSEGSCKISCLKDRKQTNVLYLHHILQQQNKVISIIICSDV